MYAQIWSDIGAWAGRFLFEILPLAFLMIYDWIKEWQTLIVGVMVIAAARYFHLATLRSTRMIAEAAIRSARIAAAPLAKDSQAEPPKTDVALASQTIPLPFANDVAAKPPAPAETSIEARLEALRNAVRATLAVVPTSSGSIGAKGIEFYRKVAAFHFDDVDASGAFDSESVSVFRELQTTLDTLRLESAEETDAVRAWKILVQINILARELLARSSQNANAHLRPRTAVPVVR
jgi:hypothetical protein